MVFLPPKYAVRPWGGRDEMKVDESAVFSVDEKESAGQCGGRWKVFSPVVVAVVTS